MPCVFEFLSRPNLAQHPIMSHLDPSASVSSFASNTTKGTATPDASTANLIPPAQDGRSSTHSLTSTSESTSSSSRAATSSRHPTAAPRSQTYPASSNAQPKDYEQAFATLSSAWGFGALVPAKNPKSAKDRGDKKDKTDKKYKRRKDKQNASPEGVSGASSPALPSTTSANSTSGQRSNGTSP